MLLSSFKTIRLSVQKKKLKINLKIAAILDFRSEQFKSLFDAQVRPMLPSKFEVNWSFSSGEKANTDFQDGHHISGEKNNKKKNRFSRWKLWRLSWISDRNNFSSLIYKSPRCFLPSFKSVGLWVQKKKRKIYFQDGGHGSHLGFPVRTILAIFDLQVALMLSTKF